MAALPERRNGVALRERSSKREAAMQAQAAVTSGTSEAQAAELAHLTELNEAYVRSVATSNVAWFEQHLSADFLNSNPDGTLVDRAGFLRQIAKPIAITGLRCEDVRIRILGDAAIIHARTIYAKPDGQPGAGRYTDIWMRGADGSWRCVAAHVTRA
jgi:ketosteroid isomerase-like protein